MAAVGDKIPDVTLRHMTSDGPAAVSSLELLGQGKVVLSLSVGANDMGRIIGRRGRTAQAIRALVGAAGARDGVTTSVDIVD